MLEKIPEMVEEFTNFNICKKTISATFLYSSKFLPGKYKIFILLFIIDFLAKYGKKNIDGEKNIDKLIIEFKINPKKHDESEYFKNNWEIKSLDNNNKNNFYIIKYDESEIVFPLITFEYLLELTSSFVYVIMFFF